MRIEYNIFVVPPNGTKKKIIECTSMCLDQIYKKSSKMNIL